MAEKPDVTYDPFVFRTWVEQQQVSVAELDGMMHLAWGEMGLWLPLPVWQQLVYAWGARPGASEKCPSCYESTTSGLYTSAAGITHCGCYEHDEEDDPDDS